jgi:histone acetyltransferase (RNA polymerase elongator complex component)
MAHESLLKEMKNSFYGKWTIDAENFYSRLYWNYELYENEDEYFKNWRKRERELVEIIWTQPDLKSFRNFVCLDTRSREVRNRIEKKQTKNLNLVLHWYSSSVGQECFISFEDELGYLYGFTRLLLPNDNSVVWIEGLGRLTAIIRELHVYGELQKIWDKSGQWTQHTWLWRKLLLFAEKLSRQFGYIQLSVISWVWVREYYRSLWFELKWTYMVKNIK